MVNGFLFETYARNGWQYLRSREQAINDMNVFPVSDGDTGTNMSLTLENGLRYAGHVEHLGQYMQGLARGMLLGARGNSGVIFSQIIKGMSLSLKECASAGVWELTDAFTEGYKTAYAAVTKPTEGTILTVAREGIERLRPSINDEMSTDELLRRLLSCMTDTLRKTPDLLPVLKEAGVLDSGGMGLVAFFTGFVEQKDLSPVMEMRMPSDRTSFVPEQEEEDEHGYCTEFILHNEREDFSFDSLKDYLETMGTSIVALQDQDLVKVHIHTEQPMQVLNKVGQFGTFYNIKVENLDVMCEQQAERNKKLNDEKIRRKGIAYVAVAQGSGIIRTLQDLGCDAVINGGATMNASAEDFLKVYESLPTEHIIVMPNDHNVEMAATQAATLTKNQEISVLSTGSMAEGYFAMSMIDAREKDVKKQIHNMQQGLEGVYTLRIAKAAADRTMNGITCSAGEYIALFDHTMVASDPELTGAVLKGMAAVEDIESLGTVVIFRGKDISEEDGDMVSETIMEQYDNLSCGVIDGGQQVYELIIGITA